MNSLLQSSLYGKEFIKYKQNNTNTYRKQFSRSINDEDIPVVIDSIDDNLSKQLAGKDQRRIHRNGCELKFNKNFLINEIIIELKSKIKLDQNKIYKLGLENGTILNGNENIELLYKKYKNKDDDILYLLLTEELTIYGYIMSILRYIFGKN